SGALRFLHGVCARAQPVVACAVFTGHVDAQYPVPPPEFTASLPTPSSMGSDVSRDLSTGMGVLLWSLLGVFAFLCWRVARSLPARLGVPAGVLLIAGALLQFALFYQMSVLCYVAGSAFSLRSV